ncbi:MAG: ATP-dependent Lon protease [Gammaproteobacteria bacterium]|jgi:ATP-dependent Lon protease
MSKDHDRPDKRRAQGAPDNGAAQKPASDVFESVDESGEKAGTARADARDDSVVIDADPHGAPTNKAIVRAADVLPTTLHILPLAHRPFFPVQAMPLVFAADPWFETLEAVVATPHRLVGLLLARPGAADPPAVGEFHDVGTIVRVHNAVRGEDHIQLLVEGVHRFRIRRWMRETAPYLAQVRHLEESQDVENDEIKAYAMATLAAIKELIPLSPLYSEEVQLSVNRLGINQPASLAYFAANLTSASGEALQQILQELSLKTRLVKALELLHKELELARLQANIREQVESSMSKHQRRFFLREQLKAIQKELGIAKDDRTAEIEAFQARLESRQPSESARKRIDQELDKLSILERGSPEYAVTRNYLDWLTDLPWGVHSKDSLNLRRARKVLDAEHSGLDDVKERILEFLAVGKLRGGVAGSILLLIGPPGVGKTSIGRSVADALGRKFFRFSVGGMRDEAEIKGHRRTYIGAQPGKFIQALKDVATSNPVIMLDEVDKIGASYQGDPASALLEALDPEQNTDFLDHYLDVRFDLSDVLFVCTANQIDTIPGPLLDRMEVIRLGGYIATEKVDIARQHLWPRQLERAGLKPSQLKLSDAALNKLIDGYAREAGVRGLDKQLAKIVRKAAVRIVRGEKDAIRIGNNNLEDVLGAPPFRSERPRRGVGLITGLAWTALGGVTLTIESALVHADGRGFKQTGQLGNVMRESAEIAYSYVCANLDAFGVDRDFFDKAFVHLHVPEGATPKDGPSAGITMATALLSLARKQRIKGALAMTGELTLTGQVLPVGGIREKIIAARRVRINELILPEANRRDYDELPAHIRAGVTVHFASSFADVFAVAFDT